MIDGLLNELRGSIRGPLQKGEWDAIRHFGERCLEPFNRLNRAIAGPDIARVERIRILEEALEVGPCWFRNEHGDPNIYYDGRGGLWWKCWRFDGEPSKPDCEPCKALAKEETAT